MKKGKFGIVLCLYTVLAFLMAYFGNSTVLFLLAGAVIFLEKDEWAGRQVIQAFCLYFARSVVNTIMGIFSPISRIPGIGSIWNLTDSLVDSLVSIFVLVFCIVGIINNLAGKDANIIGASKLADWAYGAVNASKDAE